MPPDDAASDDEEDAPLHVTRARCVPCRFGHHDNCDGDDAREAGDTFACHCWCRNDPTPKDDDRDPPYADLHQNDPDPDPDSGPLPPQENDGSFPTDPDPPTSDDAPGDQEGWSG